MNDQEQMMQIISVISEKTGESPEKVVAMLQEIMQTEGQEGVKAFIDKMLNPEAGMFRKGGKMEAAVNKFQRGGVYNRAQGRQNKRDAGIDYDTEMADYTARGAQNQGAKIAKAKAVQGFENANFIDPEDFDRSIYRQRKREARDMDFTRRQRKAYALTEQPDVEIRAVPTGLISPIRQRLDIPKRTPGKAVIEVGDITAEVLSDPMPPKQTPVKTVNVDPKTPIRKAGWDQFFYENYYRDKNNGGDIRPDQSMMGYQRAMEDEYRKYFSDPENYVRGSIDPETINKYDRLVRRGVERLKYSSPSKNAGYYDPEISYVSFGDTQAPLLTTDTGKAMNKVAHGITGTILATAAAPKVAEGVVDAGKAVYNGGKRLWEAYRDAYKAQQQYLNQGGARGSEMRQMTYHRPTLNNHTMPEGYVVPQQGVGVKSMYVPAEKLMGFLGLKKGGKVNKCQDGEKVLDMIKKKKK